MSGLVCITNDMRAEPRATRPWPCTLRDRHLETCSNDECWGCFPRPAEFGCLCAHCFEKANDAVKRSGAMIRHLRSIETEGQALGERVSTSREHRILMPQSWLTADALLKALTGREIPSTATLDGTQVLVEAAMAEWSDLRARVSREADAASAVRVTLIMRGALRRWPGAEAESRPIPRPIRCAKCSRLSLVRKAPLDYLGDIYVECEECGDRTDWWEWIRRYRDLASAVIDARKREENERRKARKEKSA